MTLDADLARSWLRVERSLSTPMERVTRNLVAARSRGQNVQTWMLGADPGWLNLTSQLGTQTSRFSGNAAIEIARAAGKQAELGRLQVRAYLKQLGAADYQSGLRRVPDFTDRQALYRYMLDKGVPADALQGMQKAMLESVQAGKSATEAVQAGKDGMARGLNRSLLVSRDQVARAGREAADQEMLDSGQVAMKQRVVRRVGACAACLAKDGELIPVEEPGYDHSGGFCQFRPVLKGKQPVRRSADTWLRTQPAAYQREVLGNKRYEAFRDGRIELSSVAVTTEHSIWGKGLRVRPLDSPVAPLPAQGV